MPSCKNGVGSYTGKEPSPKGRGYCARHEKIGTKKRGRDKKMWVVKSVKLASGKRSRRWFKVLPPAKKSKVKPTKRKRPTSTQKRKATAPTRKRKPTTQKRKAPARKMSTSTRKRKATAPTRKRKPTTQRRKRLRGGGELTKYEMDLLLKYIGDKWFRKNGMNVPKTARQCSPICAAWFYKAWESNQTSFYLPTTEEKRDKLKNYFSEIQADGSDYRQNSEVAKKCIDQFYEWLQSNYDPAKNTQASYTSAQTPYGEKSVEEELNYMPLEEMEKEFERFGDNLRQKQSYFIEQTARISKLYRKYSARSTYAETWEEREAVQKYSMAFRAIVRKYLDMDFIRDVDDKCYNDYLYKTLQDTISELKRDFVGNPKYMPANPNLLQLEQGLNFEPTIEDLKDSANAMEDGSDQQTKLFSDTLNKINRELWDRDNYFDKTKMQLLRKYKKDLLNLANAHSVELEGGKHKRRRKSKR